MRSTDSLARAASAAKVLWSHGREAVGERQVLILGEARSGTSLLYRCLLAHPAFVGPCTNLVESHVIPVAHQPQDFHEEDICWRMRAYLGDVAFEHFRDEVELLRPLSLRMASWYHASGRKAWWYGSGAAWTLRNFYWHARRVRGVRRVVDKTPSVVQAAGRLRHALPRADLLYIHRDPVDVFASYRRRAAHDPTVADTFGIRSEVFIERWRARSLAALAAAQDPTINLGLVCYEHLVHEPNETLRRVSRMVGEAFDDRMLKLPDHTMTRFAPDPHLSGRITAETHASEDWITPHEASAINDALGPLARQLEATGHRASGRPSRPTTPHQ